MKCIKYHQKVDLLLHHANFTIGAEVFRQIIGIPMESDSAPFFTNLFLYFYERQSLFNLKKSDLIKARKLFNAFRFADDRNMLSVVGNLNNTFQRSTPVN